MLLIDGKKIAQEIQVCLQEQVAALTGRKPGIAFVLVGDNPASQSYVRSKKKACAFVGIVSVVIELPGAIAESDLLKELDKLNRDLRIDGILVQLPLPPHIDEGVVTAAINPAKDVDGFHPVNVGKMLLGDESGFLPCTPLGIQVLLEKSQIQTAGKHVVIIGRSNIVGKPLAAILMQKKPHCNATVTIAHSQSENLPALTRSADILVTALGRPLFLKKEMVKPGSAVIDVGINRLPDGKLVGDVDFASVSQVAGKITPVPGGVGPMTIAMLLHNTLKSFLKLCLIILTLASCHKAPPKDPCTYFGGVAMTMPYRIAIGKQLSDQEQRTVSQTLEKAFSEVHETFDNWNPRSEVSRLNAAPADTLLPLSPPLQNLLALCDEIVSLSGGRFDPTVEPLGRLWRQPDAPSTEELQTACDSLGWHHICIQNGIFQKDSCHTHLDLCAISKGWCIDSIAQRLQAMGYNDFLVEWAGEMRASGHHPANRDWTVQINPNLLVQNQPIAPIPLRNNAIATSSNQLIIDPLTASPLEKTDYSVAFATVIAPTCALADALATAAVLFNSRKEAESWAQEVVETYPDVSFWILSYRKDP
jgi:methylenetetrahydrofolate dehydrogenase (NADP+)/methenyltetrahydrofolate cyclohydrolase